MKTGQVGYKIGDLSLLTVLHWEKFGFFFNTHNGFTLINYLINTLLH